MIRRLAGQTAIYGIPSIVGRLINFLLVFLYTAYFKPEIFAAHVEFYAYAAFILVILPHGMETAFFNFLRRDFQLKTIFSTSFYSVLLASLVFLVLTLFFSSGIANFMHYPEHKEYVQLFAFILFFDVLAMIPFALLRHRQKAGRFAFIRSMGIFLNILFNLLFIVYFPRWFDSATVFYNPDWGIASVFIANLIASVLSFLLLIPDIIKNLGSFDKTLWKNMFRYAWPLILVGLAGIVNETFDRVALDRLLVSDNPKYELGVYGAFYKLSIIITIFIQAFRYAAEPFFFERSKGQDAKNVYAEVMNYFVAVCLGISLLTIFFLDWLAPFAIRQEAFFQHPDGLKIVAPLLLANVFLGMVYNLSIWYKIEDKNKLGAIISLCGAVITILSLVIFIPMYGFIAAAYTTLAAYFSMAVLSYVMGQKHYPVPYELKVLLSLFGTGFVLYLLDKNYLDSTSMTFIFYKTLLFCAYILTAYWVVIRRKKT